MAKAKPITPERALWLAVVARVWGDAFEASDWFRRLGGRSINPEVTRGNARRWLTLDFGDWAKDRETVCSLADIDPDTLRNAARRKLAELKAAEAEQRTVKVVELDRSFSALLEGSESMAPADIDKALVVRIFRLVPGVTA